MNSETTAISFSTTGVPAESIKLDPETLIHRYELMHGHRPSDAEIAKLMRRYAR